MKELILKRKMKMAFIIAKSVYRWQFETITKALHSDDLEVVLIQIADQNDSSDSARKKPGRLYELYELLDTKFLSYQPDAMEIMEDSDLSSLKCTRLKFQSNSDFGEQSKPLFDIGFDLIINLTSEELSPPLLNLSRIGTFQFHFGDESNPYSIPMGFWEVVKKKGEIGMVLSLLSAETNPMIVYKCSSLTNFRSLIRSRNIYFWKVPGILDRELKELCKDEKLYLKRRKDKFQNSCIPEGLPSDFPSNIQMFKWLWVMTIRVVSASIYKRLHTEQWILLFKLRDPRKIKNKFSEFVRITPPKDRFWADPFVRKKGDTYYIFIEELLYKDRKGFISVLEMDNSGNYGSASKIIEEDYHLSYPFLFEDKGELYMIPETYENRTIQIYKCHGFPYTWKLEKILMNKVMAVDTTIIYLNDLYWMFTNMASHEATSTYDELFLFYSDKLLTDQWISHPENPIVTDVKNARPAGNLFRVEGKLYRPSQNCSTHYGYGMQINEVLELSKTNYKERIVESVFPDWDKDLIATHTLNSDQEMTVIDALIQWRN